MSENVKEKRVANNGGQETEGQEGGQSMSPPVFQLMAEPVPPPDNKGGGAIMQRQVAPQEQENGPGGLPQEYLAHLRLREGDRADVYLDSRGFPTCGVGHLLSAAERRQYPVGTIVPRQVRDRWLAQDSRGAYDAAVAQAGQLNVSSQAFINALGSVNFQLGTHWNRTFTHTWGLMMQHHWEQAAVEVAKSAWARQTPVRVHDFQAALRALANGGNSGGGGSGGNTHQPPSGGHTNPPPTSGGHASRSGTITGDNVNVRSGPGTNHHTVGSQLDRGAHVSIFEESHGWMRIGTGRWVKAEYIRVTPPSAGTPIGHATITGDNVNVRKGPGTSHDTIGNQLDRGASVTIYERRDGWARIGVGRWVKEQFMRINGSPSNGGHTTNPGNGGHTNPPNNGGHTNTPGNGGHTNAPGNGGHSGRQPTVIGASVGQGGRNVRADVIKIQQLLHALGFRIAINGSAGKNTIGAIASFQEAMNISSDGRVDPGGRTLSTMNASPNGAFDNTAEHLREDRDAPRLTHSRWTNRAHMTTDTADEILPRQFYGNMNRLIQQMNVIADNLRGSFNVNCGYRSPYYNSTLENSASQSNHQFGRAVDIDASSYSPSQLKAELKKLIRAGKIHNGGIGLYSWGCHYDIDSPREWNG